MKRTPILHPFLFSLFPLIALYAYNIKRVPVPLRDLAGPLALSLAFAVMLYFAIRIVLKDGVKAGLLVTLLVLWFLSFGHISALVVGGAKGAFGRSFFLATFLLLGLAAFFILRSRRDWSGLTRVLNVVAAALVLFNVASIVQASARRPRVFVSPVIKTSGPAASRPNIYYIVLDAYTRADVLEEVFSFDNSGFLSDLEARGFAVASESYANYGWTYHSLASSLNMDYLDDVAKKIRGTTANQEPLYRMIQENRAMAFLKSQGYEILCFSSSVKPGDIKDVDASLGFAGASSEFLSALLNTTPLPLLFNLKAVSSTYGAHRAHVLDAFRALEESPARKGPFFFFVHLMSPHPPFVFDPDGEPAEPGYLFSLVDADRLHGGDEAAVREYVVGYREQVAFLNKKILRAVDAILGRSPQPPIVILQGDHGSRAYANLDRPEACYLKENLAILNAYFLPGEPRALVYPRISPVNTFRLVFSQYFRAGLELIEDRSAWCTWQRPYSFFPFDDSSYEASVDSVRAATKPVAPIVQRR